MKDLATLARYPFLDDAKVYIRENGYSVDELLNDVVYERARIFGVDRVDGAIKNNDSGSRVLADESDRIMEVLSYPLARMIVVSVDDPYFNRRYANAEAVHAYEQLKGESSEFLVGMAEGFDMEVRDLQAGKVSVFFKDYLAHAPSHDRYWKLVNKEMSSGFVILSLRELARLYLEALRSRLVSELEGLQSNDVIRKAFSSDIQRFRAFAEIGRKKRESAPVGRVDVGCLPPCMNALLSSVQAGENVPHMGRFGLVSFLGSLGLKSDDIMKLFAVSPDFNEEMTAYQVNHILGESSSTAYKAPSCEKMRTFGLCPADGKDRLCRYAKTPLWYYHQRWRDKKGSSESDDS